MRCREMQPLLQRGKSALCHCSTGAEPNDMMMIMATKGLRFSAGSVETFGSGICKRAESCPVRHGNAVSFQITAIEATMQRTRAFGSKGNFPVTFGTAGETNLCDIWGRGQGDSGTLGHPTVNGVLKPEKAAALVPVCRARLHAVSRPHSARRIRTRISRQMHRSAINQSLKKGKSTF